jgi:hypothetical protein
MRRIIIFDFSRALLLLVVLWTRKDKFAAAQELEQCGTYACCIDCLCCGPGTGWDGTRCVPEELLTEDPGPCGVLEIIESVGCVDLSICEGTDCCGAGTSPAVDPTREPDACYCIPEDIARTDPPVTRGPMPTDSPTPGRVATRDPTTRVP